MKKTREGEVNFFTAVEGMMVTLDDSRVSDLSRFVFSRDLALSRFIIEVSGGKDRGLFNIKCYQYGNFKKKRNEKEQ